MPRAQRIGRVILRTVGAILLAAAALKGHQLLTEPLANNDIWSYRPFLILQVEFELLLGFWLLSGIFIKAAWLTSLACFCLFSLVTFCKGLTGAASCGCFGSLHVNPWVTLFALDLPTVALLSLFRPDVSVHVPSFSLRGRQSIHDLLLEFLTPFPSLSHLTITSILGLTLLGVTAPMLALTVPPTATSTYEVLEPETWVGKELPILGHIDIAEQISKGTWLLLFYHHDCPDCREAIPQYEQIARDLAGNEDFLRIALIEVPPCGTDQARGNSPCLLGRLADVKEWFITTPATTLLVGARVKAAWERSAPDFANILAQLAASGEGSRPKPDPSGEPSRGPDPATNARCDSRDNSPSVPARATPQQEARPDRPVQEGIAGASTPGSGAGRTSGSGHVEESMETYLRSSLGSALTPWELMHSLLALGPSAQVPLADGRTVNVITYLLGEHDRTAASEDRLFHRGAAGIAATVWSVHPRHVLQDHEDQLLMALALSGTPLHQPVILHDDGQSCTVADLLRESQANWTEFREQEWTAVAYRLYLPARRAAWRNRFGRRVDLDEVITTLIAQGLAGSACAGTHSLFAGALIHRLDREEGLRRDTGAKLASWLRLYLDLAVRHQGKDGGFSAQWAQRSAAPSSVAESLWISGHMLEWMALAWPLSGDDGKRACEACARHLARIAATPDVLDRSRYGELAHAVHALSLYRRLVEQGETTWSGDIVPVSGASSR